MTAPPRDEAPPPAVDPCDYARRWSVRTAPEPPAGTCPECGGATVKHKGAGWDIQVWICPRKDEPGHLTREEATAIHRQYIADYGPRESRWA